MRTGRGDPGGAGRKPADDNDAAAGIGPAGHQFGLNLPIFRCFGQFSLNILSLGKQAQDTCFQQRRGLGEQWGIGASARAVIASRAGAALAKSCDSLVMDNRRNPGFCDRGAQEIRLLADALDKVDLHARPLRERACDDEAGEARTRAEISPGFASGASGKSWSESAMWRVQIVDSVEGATRLPRVQTMTVVLRKATAMSRPVTRRKSSRFQSRIMSMLANPLLARLSASQKVIGTRRGSL